MPFHYVDLFCGIGGFSQGAARWGGRLVAACDLDPTVREVFARNYGLEPHDDVRTMPRPPRTTPVHLLCAGFPCQPFSRAGKRDGTDSENGRLFHALLAYAVAARVPCLLLENVADLLLIDDGRTFAEFERLLREAGYRVRHAVLNSADFGAPQVRHRLFVVAHRRRTFDFSRLQAVSRAGSYAPLRPHLDPDLEACRALAFPAPFVLPPRPSPTGLLRCHAHHATDQTHRVWHPDGPMPTQLSSNPTKIYDPRLRLVRKLTPREMLACQGFPADFRLPARLKHYGVMHLVGNAVTVDVVHAVIAELVRQGLLPPPA